MTERDPIRLPAVCGNFSPSRKAGVRTLQACLCLSIYLAVALAHVAYADAKCDLVFDALEKAQTLPNHSFSESVDSVGKHIYQESVRLDHAFYLRTNGQWTRRDPRWDETGLANSVQRPAAAKCELVQSEILDGRKVSVYEMHSPWQHGVPSTSKLWIFEDSGLPLRWEFEVNAIPLSRSVSE